MKRILTLLLALSLCILVSCKEEIPEKPIEEISVEETPVEKEDIPKEEPPIEKEDEPTEETPTEKTDKLIEEAPAEPEIKEPTEEIGEDVIILPEANENTKIITIEFPEDFPETPYKEPEFVSPEEFEWGEYYPIVCYAVDVSIENNSLICNNSVLSPISKTIEQGNEVFNNIEEKNSPIIDSYKNSRFSLSVLPASIRKNLYTVTKNDKFEVFEEVLLASRKYSKQSIYVIDGFDGKLAYEIKLPYINQDGLYIKADALDFVSEKFLFFSLTKLTETNIISHMYSLNVETQELSLVERHISSYWALVSPDGKYIVYQRPLRDGDAYTKENNLDEMRDGFYIKNLENSSTCFFEYDFTEFGFSEFPFSQNKPDYAFWLRGWVNKIYCN